MNGGRIKAVGQPGLRTPLRLEVTTIGGAAGGRPQIATIGGELIILSSKDHVPGDSNGNGILDAADVLDALKMSATKTLAVSAYCRQMSSRAELQVGRQPDDLLQWYRAVALSPRGP